MLTKETIWNGKSEMDCEEKIMKGLGECGGVSNWGSLYVFN